jgi:hypothetical protein
VLLAYRREDHRRERTAVGPAGVRDDAGDDLVRQRFAGRTGVETSVDLVDTGVMLAGIELAGDNRFSRLHVRHSLFDLRFLPAIRLAGKIYDL